MHAPSEFVETVSALKKRLIHEGHEIFEFIPPDTGSSKDVYKNDIHHCIAHCDGFVAVCDHPSLGLGWELGAAVEKFRKPTLALVHQESKISRLIIGAAYIESNNYCFVRYSDLDDMFECVVWWAESL